LPLVKHRFGKPPLVSCPWLLIQYIYTYLGYQYENISKANVLLQASSFLTLFGLLKCI